MIISDMSLSAIMKELLVTVQQHFVISDSIF